MKKFLSKFSLFFGITIILNIAIYISVTSPLLFKNYYNLKHEKIFTKVLFADSHGAYIKDKYLNNIGITNASFESDSYSDMYFKFCYILRHAHIDTVFLTVDDHTLSIYREKLNNIERSVYYGQLSDLNDSLSISPLNFIYSRSIRKYLPLFDVNKSSLIYYYLRSKLMPNHKDHQKNEWASLSNGQKYIFCENRFHTQFPSQEKSTVLKSTLSEIIYLCKSKGITLIGIRFPISKNYIPFLSGINNDADLIFKNKGIPVIDFKYLFVNHDEFFFNPDHLNDEGAIEFCKILKKEIDRPGQITVASGKGSLPLIIRTAKSK